MKHWFWHIVAMLTVCDWATEEVSDAEFERYLHFMRRHGFDGPP